MIKKNYLIFLFIFLFSNFGTYLFTQSPAGIWIDSKYNIKLILNGNYTYSLEHPKGKSSGQWRNNGSQFCLYDSSGATPVCYSIISYSANLIVMKDINGFVLNYRRAGFQTDNPGDIIQRKGNVTLYYSHLKSGVDLIQFIIGGKIRSSEVIELKNKLIEEFNESPAFIIKELLSIGASMQKVRNSTDALSIGNVRQALFTMLYKSTQKIEESKKPLIIQIINRYIKVFAFDEKNNLLLTNRDIDGYINYVIFNSYLSGNKIHVNNSLKQILMQQLINNFSSMNIEQKQILASSSLVWELVEANWKNLTLSQKQQYMLAYQAKVSQNFKPVKNQYNLNYSNNWSSKSKKSIADIRSEAQTKNMYFKIMNNMNMNSHALSMNIIENIGGTGNYWEVVDY